MTQVFFGLRNSRSSRWLQPQGNRRASSMVSRAASRRAHDEVTPRVYCDPRMPQGWTAISE